MGLTRRVLRCAPVFFLVAIPTVVVSQVAMILAFMLPLKIIILIGSDGIPRFLSFFMTEETKNQWVIYLCLLSVGMFLLHLLANRILQQLGAQGGDRIRRQSDKATLFNAEAEYASQVFLRLAESWGTLLMVGGGVLLGLLLEWRMVLALVAAIAAQTLWLAWHWNRHQAPEKAEVRQQFVDQHMKILHNLAGVNTIIAFAVLVVLFLTDPSMNFLVGLVMFILTRQVLVRMIKGVQDGYFLSQQRERIEALVYPERHVRERRQSSVLSFESLLMPSSREKVFDAVATFEGAQAITPGREWQWCDVADRGQALYVSYPDGPGQPELRLKIVSSANDAGLAREVLFHESPSAAILGLSPTMVATGHVFGRGFILLQSPALSPVSGKVFPDLLEQVRFRLWGCTVDEGLSQRLARSYASLDQRIDAERYRCIRLACSTAGQESLLDDFMNMLEVIREHLARVPKVLVNRTLNAGNMMVTDAGEPLVMNWDAISFDLIGTGLGVADMSKRYSPEEVLAKLAEWGSPLSQVAPCALRLVAHITELESLVAREAYANALDRLPDILGLVSELESINQTDMAESPLSERIAL